MIIKTNKLQLWIYGITIFIALVILIDFTLPGKKYTEDVLKVNKELEQYYNAAKNYHFSYTLVTPNHEFSVTEEFAEIASNNKVYYTVSPIFKEVNKYGLQSSKKRTIYSFRIASGLALPLIVIFTIIIAYKYKRKWSTLIFVLQVALLGNLIVLVQ